MSVSFSISERVFVKAESVWGTAASLSGSNYMRHGKCGLKTEQADIVSTDKTGSISATVGTAGARGGTWSLEWDARPNGAAGSKSDDDPIMVALFGQDPTLVASTSVTYTLASAIKSFTLGRYRSPANVMQQIGIGCVVQQFGFSFESNSNCRCSASGSALFVPDRVNYSSLDSIGKGGMGGSFPTEPSTPVYNGLPVNGLSGSASIDSNTTVQIRSAAIRMMPAIDIPRDRLFNSQYGSSPERDVLGAFLDLTVYDEDIAAVTNLYTKALARTQVDIVLTVGAVAGQRIEWTLKNCLLPMPDLNDSARKWASNLQGIRAYPTSATSLDEIKLKIY